mgnify:CR=1 FL=1
MHGYAQPGQTISYTLQIENRGSLTDTFAIAANSLWPLSAPTAIGPLAPCSAAPLIVSVIVPADALPGASDLASLTLTSQGDPAQSLIVRLTSFVPQVVLYLPSAYR